MTDLTFITGNMQKVENLHRFLGIPLAHRKLDVPEIQSLDLAEVVTAKAKAAYALLGTPVLVEDTALRIHTFGRLPGPLVKWFLEELGNEGICRLLPPGADRSATAETMYAVCEGEEVRTFHGELRGTVLERPDGANAASWEAAFLPDGARLSWGRWDEYTTDEQERFSMRRPASALLRTYLADRA